MASSVAYQRKRALVIGINDYISNPLEYCINDAQNFKKTLESIGFDVTFGLNSNRTTFCQVFKEFVNGTQRTDLILFYFAGHGKPYKSENYLLLSDYAYTHRKSEDKYMPDNAIQVGHIMTQLIDKKSLATIFIFDCCRKYMSAVGANVQQGLLPMKASPQTVIAYSSCPGAVTRTETGDGNNGYLMENLLKHITTPNTSIEDVLRNVARDVRSQTSGLKLLHQKSCLTKKVFLVTSNVQDPIDKFANGPRSSHTSNDRTESYHIQGTEQFRNRQKEPIHTDTVENNSSVQSLMQNVPKVTVNTSTDNPTGISRNGKRTPERMKKVVESVKLPAENELTTARSRREHSDSTENHLYSSATYNVLAQIRKPASYPSEIFGVDGSTPFEIRILLEYLSHALPLMDKHGPMSGQCIRETDQMENFLERNFGFTNIKDQYIVSGVRAFELHSPVSMMNNNTRIYFPKESHDSFTMSVFEIKKWQSSFVVYADRSIAGMDKAFLCRALQGQSMDGAEAFRMKFVVRISDCPILMKFNAQILPRSLDYNWPNCIKLVSVTGIDFAGRKHDVDDITTYITNWKEVFVLDRNADKPAVFRGRDFYPVKRQPPVQLDKNRLFDDLIRMVKLRLRACDQEGVQIVVETGIGLGVFSGKHLGIDSQVRMLSARAIRCVLQHDCSTYKNIRAVVFALPIFSRIRDGNQLSDTYHDFVNEFHESKYSGPIPVLIADQDMHELTVAIALQGFRVSQLNPADSHGVFGEYWQNHGPAVEEKLALTTLGLLVQHHLINCSVLDESRYHII